MLCRRVSSVICAFVAVVVATDSIEHDSISGSDSEANLHHLSNNSLDSSTAEPMQEVAPDAAVELGWLLDAGEGAVVALVSGGTRLLAHRAVLAARSPVLQRLLQDAATGEVAVPGVEGPVLRQLLAYLYTLQAPQLPAVASQLLAAAHQYGLPALKADCERQVAAQLTVQTAADTAVLAVRYSGDSLKKAAIDYIKAHIFQVIATQGWADALHTHPQVMTDVTRLLSDSPAETSTSAPAASRTAPTAEPQSDDSSCGQTPASAESASDTSVSPGSTEICRLRRLSAEEKGKRLTEAAYWGAVGELEALLAAGAAVDARNWRQATPLHVAAAGGHTALVRLLLSAGADHGARDEVERTPLHKAAYWGRAEAAAVLLEAGADLAARNIWDRTPLDEARWQKQAEVEQLLLQSSLLPEAANGGAVEELEALLAGRGGRGGWTALHWAAIEGREEAARRLLAAGAAVGARDIWQRTPLHLAAAWGRAATAAVLLAAGADRAARDSWGRTPLDDARRQHRGEVERLLRHGW